MYNYASNIKIEDPYFKAKALTDTDKQRDINKRIYKEKVKSESN